MFRFAVVLWVLGITRKVVLASADKPRTLAAWARGCQDPDRAITSCTTAERGSRAGGHFELYSRLVKTRFTMSG
jgi:hypothetical protein